MILTSFSGKDVLTDLQLNRAGPHPAGRRHLPRVPEEEAPSVGSAPPSLQYGQVGQVIGVRLMEPLATGSNCPGW